MIEKPCKYRAKAIDGDKIFEGYYFEYPETTYCFDTDPKPETIHCLISHTMTDWCLPNKPYLVVIDINTLERIENERNNDEAAV